MVRLVGFSGGEVVNILERDLGFKIISQKGSHIKLRKQIDSRAITVIVPNHKELAPGTLRGVLRQAEITPKDFIQHK